MNTSSADTTRTSEAGSGRTRASRARSTKVGLAAVLVLLGTFAGLVAGEATPGIGVDPRRGGHHRQPRRPGAAGLGRFHRRRSPSTLPANAACDGDTATDGYHVFSYLQPEGTNPLGVLFTTGFPSVVLRAASPAAASTTGRPTPPPPPGRSSASPTTSSSRPCCQKGVSLDTLLYADGNTSGVWEAGIACANSSGAVTDYWNTEVTFTASGTDPNGFVWSRHPRTVHHQRHRWPSTRPTAATFNQRAAERLHRHRRPDARTPPSPRHRHTPQRRHLLTPPDSAHRQPDPERVASRSPCRRRSGRGLRSPRASRSPCRPSPRTRRPSARPPVATPRPPSTSRGPSNNGGATITSYKVTATDDHRARAAARPRPDRPARSR